MSESEVLFLSPRTRIWDAQHSLPGRLRRALASLELGRMFEPGEAVALKTHFGSEGSFRTVRPAFHRIVAEAVRAAGARPFITDTVRIPALQYLEIAAANGFTEQSCAAPIVISDGVFGRDNILVDSGPVLGQVAIASAIYDAPAMVVISHCKGHVQAGFGGAIKNLAMGGVSARHREKGKEVGRGHMHLQHGMELIWSAADCTFCELCVKVCAVDALRHDATIPEIVIEQKKCWGCCRCARVCPTGAMSAPQTNEIFQAGLAEAAKAVIDTFAPGKILYLNFPLEVQPECDCMPIADVPFVQDQGILIGTDPVAVEQATIDLINKAELLPDSAGTDPGVKRGKNNLLTVNPLDPELCLEACAKLGLGSREYCLAPFE